MVISFWRFKRCKLLKQWISNFKAHLLFEQPWPLEPQQGPSTLALTLYNDHTNLRLSMVRMIIMIIMVSIYKFGKYGKNGKYGKCSKFGKHDKNGKYSQYSKYNKYTIQLLSVPLLTSHYNPERFIIHHILKVVLVQNYRTINHWMRERVIYHLSQMLNVSQQRFQKFNQIF